MVKVEGRGRYWSFVLAVITLVRIAIVAVADVIDVMGYAVTVGDYRAYAERSAERDRARLVARTVLADARSALATFARGWVAPHPRLYHG